MGSKMNDFNYKGKGVVLCEGRERGVYCWRLGLDGLLFGGGGGDLRSPVFLDDLAARPEGEGVPARQVTLAFIVSFRVIIDDTLSLVILFLSTVVIAALALIMVLGYLSVFL